ncbi:MAG TPA: ring-cleaving dioxygenase [Thermoanaerobaculia bacterium]|nr:ring-cleaving dioxygenase [Thermoanaerobaculia bacterium]
MKSEIEGIHHVTAIASDAQRNVDCYVGLLGLRLVKRTVNFDDPDTYHLYYGDEAGTPGSILTFFPWAHAVRGSRGVGQTSATAFSVPEGALGFWRDRLASQNVLADGPVDRLDRESVLTLFDPDGLKLELIAHPGAEERAPWAGSGIPERYAIRGFHSVTLTERSLGTTVELLTETMGFRRVAGGGGRSRFDVGAGGAGAQVDLIEDPSGGHGRIAAGSVHHVAFRVVDDAAQEAWLEDLAARGLPVTPIQDRQYFHSIYYREPGGVLFELATDPPGFTLDEPLATLGSELKLPPWLEAARPRIEAALPKLQVPAAEGGA